MPLFLGFLAVPPPLEPAGMLRFPTSADPRRARVAHYELCYSTSLEHAQTSIARGGWLMRQLIKKVHIRTWVTAGHLGHGSSTGTTPHAWPLSRVDSPQQENPYFSSFKTKKTPLCCQFDLCHIHELNTSCLELFSNFRSILANPLALHARHAHLRFKYLPAMAGLEFGSVAHCACMCL